MDMQIFSGSANQPLAAEVADRLGIRLGRALVGTFRDGETRIRIEESVRGADVFVVQPTSAPTNHHIMELVLMLDALRRASAQRITAVVPFYGYARQDKKRAGREPISARLVANMLVAAGAHRVLALDLHTPAINGLFDIPVDHLHAVKILTDRCRLLGLDDPVVVSPDAGGVARANDFRTRLGASLAIVAKHRSQPEVPAVLEMVGSVQGKHTVIVDDLIATGDTVIRAADLLLERGALSVTVFAVHAPLADQAREAIAASPILRVFVTNSILFGDAERAAKFEVLTVAPLLAEAITRIHTEASVSALFA